MGSDYSVLSFEVIYIKSVSPTSFVRNPGESFSCRDGVHWLCAPTLKLNEFRWGVELVQVME